jgi:PAS domain S-box-containing protein
MGIFSRNNKNNSSGGGNISQSLRDEKRKSDLIVGNINDAVVLIDADNIIQTFNPAAAALTGRTEEEALSIDYRSVVKLGDEKGRLFQDADHPFYKVFSTGKASRSPKSTITRKDNTVVAVDVSLSPIVDSNGYISGAIAVIRNVDEQRKQEKRSADFISTASHEMRTPVAAIEGYLSLALNEKVSTIDTKARNYLEKAYSSTNHLGQLFQDLLTSAKAEDGRLTSHPVIVEVGQFIEKLAEDLRFSAEKKGLKLELVKEARVTISPLLYSRIDPDRFREVITNLFDNAVKYTDSGKISFGITGDQSVVQFHISDTGEGIPQADIGHLFQKFYRVDSSATRTIGGTGLGLFISRKIVQLYNGRIWVESETGKGSTFYINLPRVDSKIAESELSSGPGSTVNPQQPGL